MTAARPFTLIHTIFRRCYLSPGGPVSAPQCLLLPQVIALNVAEPGPRLPCGVEVVLPRARNGINWNENTSG